MICTYVKGVKERGDFVVVVVLFLLLFWGFVAVAFAVLAVSFHGQRLSSVLRAAPSLHAVGLQLLGLVLHEGGGGGRGGAGGDGGLHCTRVAVPHKPGGRGGSVGVLVVGSGGVLGIGLAGGGVVDVGRGDGLHGGGDHHAGLDDSLGVNIVRREPVEAKGESQQGLGSLQPACPPPSPPNSGAPATGTVLPSSAALQGGVLLGWGEWKSNRL